MTTRISYPPVLLGYLFPVLFLAYEFMRLDETLSIVVGLGITLSGWGYFLWFVFLLHKDMAALTLGWYPISAKEAFWKQVAPFYNVYWLYRWPTDVHSYLVDRIPNGVFSLRRAQIGLLGGLFLARLDFAIGFALLWSSMSAIVRTFQRQESLLESTPRSTSVVDESAWDPAMKARLFIASDQRK